MKYFFLSVAILITQALYSQVSVTAATNLYNIGNGASCASKTLGNIIISETEKGDFSNTTGQQTYSINLPNGFVFDQTATESVTYNVIGGTSSYSFFSVSYPSASSFRVTFEITNTDNDTGYFEISGLKVKCSVLGSFGYIYRGGTAAQNTNNPADKVIHGYLDSRIQLTATVSEYDYANFSMGYNGQYSYMQTQTKFYGTIDTTSANLDVCPYNSYFYFYTPMVTGATYDLFDGTSVDYFQAISYTQYRFKSDSISYYRYNSGPNFQFYIGTGTYNIQKEQYTPMATGQKNYVMQRVDADGCTYRSSAIQINVLAPPSKWTYDATKDTSFQQDDDPVALNDYITAPVAPASTLSGISGTGIIGINSNATFLFMPGIVKVGTVYPNYVVQRTSSGCKARFYFPKPMVVSDPLSPLPDFISSSQAPPFCANGSNFTINVRETPEPGYNLYYYYIRTKNNTYSSYNSSGVTCPDITIDPKKDNPGNNLIYYSVWYHRTGLPDTSMYGYVTLYAERNPQLVGLPDPATATDSVVNICSSNNDTIFVRPTPANGALSIYRFNPTLGTYSEFKKASDFFKPIGGPGSKSTDFKFLIRQLFSDTAAADSNYNVKFKIVYSYPGTQYGQCPDTITRVIRFSRPVDIVYSLTAPTTQPFCLGDTLKMNITYQGALPYQPEDRFYWGFGDGVSREADSLLTASYLYTKPGMYFLRFKTIVDSLPVGFCNNDQQDTIRIGAKPTARFEVFQNFVGSSADFHSLATIQIPNPNPADSITQRIWRYGYNNTVHISKGTDTVFTYPVASKLPYQAIHKVVAGWGCSDSLIMNLPVFPVHQPTPIAGSLDTFHVNDVNGWYHSGQYKSTNVSSWVNTIPPDSAYFASQNQYPDPIIPPAYGHAWITIANTGDTTATYYSNDSSYVESPVYNIEDLTLPMVSLKTFYNFDNLLDGASVQYAFCDSIAFGKEQWITLGKNTEGYNWYNSKTIIGKPGNSNMGWTNDTLQKWQVSAYRLAEITNAMQTNNKKLVRFRVVLGTNGDNLPLENKSFEGFAFDDFFVGQRNRKVLVEEFCDYENYEPAVATKMVDPQAVRIQYHVRTKNIDDVLNNHNIGENGARQLHYGLWNIPVGTMDGIYKDHEKTFLTWGENQFLKRSLIQSPFNISVTNSVDFTNKKINITTTVMKNNNEVIKGPFLIHTVVVEKSVSAHSTTFSNVFRNFIPDATGQRVVMPTWPNGTSVTKTDSWTPTFQAGSMLYLISFIQDDFTKEIYQVNLDSVDAADAAAVYSSIRFGQDDAGKAAFTDAILYPNPSQIGVNLLLDGISTLEHDWTILDSYGRVVKTGVLDMGINLYSISVQDLSPGVYQIKINSTAGEINKSFTVVR